MVTESDISIILHITEWRKADGSGVKDRLHGYVLDRGYPIMAAGGWRISKDPKFKYTRFSLSFSGSDKSRKTPIEDDYVIIKDSVYETGTKLQVAKHCTGGTWYNGFKPHLYSNLVLPLGGWVSTETVKNKFGAEGRIVMLRFDDYKYDNSSNKDDYKLVDTKNLLTEQELELIKKEQFPYFDEFMKDIKETEYYGRFA